MEQLDTKNLQNLIFYRYRYALSYVAMAIIAVLSLVYKLNTLLPGLSTAEVNQGLSIVQDKTIIFEKGVYLPFNLVQSLSVDVFGSSALALRVPSVVFGFLTLIMLFILIHMWHRERIAIASVIFLSTSSWFLIFARSATPHIYMAFSLLLILLSGTLIRHSKNALSKILFSAIAFSLAIYSPYLIYVIILYALLYRKQIVGIFKELANSNRAVIILSAIIIISPLIYAFIQDIDNLKIWLGIPNGLPQLQDIPTNVSNSISHIIWNSRISPQFHLADLPMLDIFTTTMTALGLYHYEKHFNLLRTRFIIYGLGLTILLMALTTDETAYFLAAPLIYILAATGIVTLLNQWNKIFPINPFARTLALLPLAFAVLMTSQYHIDKYYVAWTKNPDTQLAYAAEPQLLTQKLQSSTNSRVLIISNQNEHKQLAFLLNDLKKTNDISILDESESMQINDFTADYDIVYLDGTIDSSLKTKLEAYQFSIITGTRESRPIAYRVYDLAKSVSLANYF